MVGDPRARDGSRLLAGALCEWSRTRPQLDPRATPRFGGVFAFLAAQQEKRLGPITVIF